MKSLDDARILDLITMLHAGLGIPKIKKNVQTDLACSAKVCAHCLKKAQTTNGLMGFRHPAELDTYKNAVDVTIPGTKNVHFYNNR